jgi:copper chaperone CopZ
MATQNETIQVTGIRCERCVNRLAAAMGKAGFHEVQLV